MVRQGDTGRELYVMSKGEASVRLRMKGTGREIRIVTFSAGTIFGAISSKVPSLPIFLWSNLPSSHWWQIFWSPRRWA